MSEITELLVGIGQGNTEAKAASLPLVCQELLSIPRRGMAHERADCTLATTALVHEAYLRLLNHEESSQYGGRALSLPRPLAFVRAWLCAAINGEGSL